MQEDHVLPLARQRGVEQFARQQTAGIRHHNEGDAELTALRLMDGERIR